MSEETNVELQKEIIEDLTIELRDEPTFDAAVLKVKVKNAIREVRLKRNYAATSYSEEQIEYDLLNYYSVIKNLALYDYNQIGAEFQSSHSENSVSRTWTDRDKLLSGVVAFVRVLY